MFLFISNKLGGEIEGQEYLNTSHVLIYRRLQLIQTHPLLFKYISCSYLSDSSKRTGRSVPGFKYISCSYLSNVFTQFSFYIIPHSP